MTPRSDYVAGVAETPRRLAFGAHADAYDRARPEWPTEAARWLVPADAKLVVELGAGTGKLTRAVAALGVDVVAVEPDERMRAVLAGHGLEGAPGSAEEIPVADGAADAVVAGSALHWFDLDRTLPEIHRVLRPGGRFAFGWNHRDNRIPAVLRMQERMHSAAPSAGAWWQRDWTAAVVGSGLFGEPERASFEHLLELPREALVDHLLSYSGIARLPEDERARVFEDVAELVDAEPSLHTGDRVVLPFVVDAFRFVRT